MNSNQQQALQNVWNAYGSINADNKDKFFNDLNTLVKKPPFPQGKHQINGPVLGQQAYDIKTYINQELGNENPGMVSLQ